MNPLLVEFLGVVFRWLITSVGAYLVAHHVINADQESRFADGALRYLLEHAVICAPLVGGLLLGLWSKYKGRIKFLTALQAQPGTTEAQVTAKIENGLGASLKAGAVLLAVVLAGAAASSCSLSLKQKTVAGLQVSETALEISHDAERRLCAPLADQTKGIGHCDGAEAAALGLTDAVHLKAAAFYSRAFDLQGKAAEAAKRWRAGDPVPSDVASYRLALNDVLDALAAVVPKEQTVITKLQEAIAEAADLAKLAGVK